MSWIDQRAGSTDIEWMTRQMNRLRFSEQPVYRPLAAQGSIGARASRGTRPMRHLTDSWGARLGTRGAQLGSLVLDDGATPESTDRIRAEETKSARQLSRLLSRRLQMAELPGSTSPRSMAMSVSPAAAEGPLAGTSLTWARGSGERAGQSRRSVSREPRPRSRAGSRGTRVAGASCSLSPDDLLTVERRLLPKGDYGVRHLECGDLNQALQHSALAGVTVIGYLGTGTNNTVLRVVGAKDEEMALRLSLDLTKDNAYRNLEVQVEQAKARNLATPAYLFGDTAQCKHHDVFAAAGLAPKLYACGKRPLVLRGHRYNWQLLQLVEMVLETWLVRGPSAQAAWEAAPQLCQLVDDMADRETPLLHGDFHMANVVLMPDSASSGDAGKSQWGAIDFEFAQVGVRFPIFDLLNLTWSMCDFYVWDWPRFVKVARQLEHLERSADVEHGREPRPESTDRELAARQDAARQAARIIYSEGMARLFRRYPKTMRRWSQDLPNYGAEGRMPPSPQVAARYNEFRYRMYELVGLYKSKGHPLPDMDNIPYVLASLTWKRNAGII